MLQDPTFVGFFEGKLNIPRSKAHIAKNSPDRSINWGRAQILPGPVPRQVSEACYFRCPRHHALQARALPCPQALLHLGYPSKTLHPHPRKICLGIDGV